MKTTALTLIIFFFIFFDVQSSNEKSNSNTCIVGHISRKGNFNYGIKQFRYGEGSTYLFNPTYLNDSTLIWRFNLSKSIDAKIVNSDIFITPGDSITLNIDLDVIVNATGENFGNYIYFQRIKNVDSPNLEHFTNKLIDYKEEINKVYYFRLKVLKEFKLMNSITNNFFEYANTEINYDRLLSLYTPLEKYYNNVPDAYLDSLINFNKSKNHSFSNKYLQLLNWSLDYKSMFPRPFFSDSVLKLMWANSNYYYKDDKDFLRYSLIRSFSRKQSKSYKSTLDSLTESILIENNQYFEKVSYWKNYYKLVGTNLSKEILELNVLKIDSTKETLANLISTKGEEIIFIDFWAQWCGPCLESLPNVQKMGILLQDKKWKFIFLSVDINEKVWFQKSTKLIKSSNQYYIFNGLDNLLTKFLEINSIPAYLIIDKYGKIINIGNHAPNSIQDYQNLVN